MSKMAIGIYIYVFALLALALLLCGCGMKFQSPISFEQKAEKQRPINLPAMYDKLPAEAKPEAFKEICGIVSERWERMDELEFRKPTRKGLSDLRVLLIAGVVVGAVIWRVSKSSTGWVISLACLGGAFLCTMFITHAKLIGIGVLAIVAIWVAFKLWEYKGRIIKAENNKSPPA